MSIPLYHELKKYGITDQKIADVHGVKLKSVNKWKTRKGVKGRAIRKLTDVDICKIRKMYFEDKEISQKKIAEMFNISETHVIDIICRKKWREI